MADETTTTTAPAGTSLAWMPIYVDDLLALAATLTPQQLGGLFRLRAYAWRQSPPATLPDSHARLAAISGLGASWAEDGPAIREHLRPIGDQGNGPRLLDEWLDDVWQKQFAKYISAATRGGKGGRPRKDGKAEGKPLLNQPEKLGNSPAFSQLQNALGSVVKSSLTQNTDESEAEGKLSFSATEAPERPISPELERQQREWLDANPGKKLPLTFHLDRAGRQAKEIEDPYRVADESVNSESAKQAVVARRLSEQFDAELAAEVERYRESHPAEYERHRIEAIKALGRFGRQLTDEDQVSIDSATAERIRRANNWISRGAYIANHGRSAATIAETNGRVAVPA